MTSSSISQHSHNDSDSDQETDHESERACFLRTDYRRAEDSVRESAAMFRFIYSRRWKWPKVLIALMLLELGGTVAGLALFGIAQPDLFRTKLWQVGADNGFNSSPSQILYAYANHQPIPKTPFVWTGALTSFNVAVSVLSMFILMVKVTMFVLHIWYPFLATVTNAVITALWIVSMYGQMGPDHSDPSRPSNIAWYVAKSCSYAQASGNEHYCIMAKGTFANTVIMAAVFFLNFALGIWSMIPSAEERAASKIEVDDMQTTMAGGRGHKEKNGVQIKDSPVSETTSDREWEMKALPGKQVPYTPRTLAFNTLDRQLPLRAQEGRWT